MILGPRSIRRAARAILRGREPIDPLAFVPAPPPITREARIRRDLASAYERTWISADEYANALRELHQRGVSVRDLRNLP